MRKSELIIFCRSNDNMVDDTERELIEEIKAVRELLAVKKSLRNTEGHHPMLEAMTNGRVQAKFQHMENWSVDDLEVHFERLWFDLEHYREENTSFLDAVEEIRENGRYDADEFEELANEIRDERERIGE